MRHKLQRTQQLFCDADTAWHFFSSPANLSKITPPELNFSVLTNLQNEDIDEGMILEYRITPLLGIPFRWQTLIKKVNKAESFTDFQSRGPYKYWNHQHQFVPNDKGVLMKDSVEYELPLGLIGEMLHRLFVRKKLEYIFDFRYKTLERLFNLKAQAI